MLTRITAQCTLASRNLLRDERPAFTLEHLAQIAQDAPRCGICHQDRTVGIIRSAWFQHQNYVSAIISIEDTFLGAYITPVIRLHNVQAGTPCFRLEWCQATWAPADKTLQRVQVPVKTTQVREYADGEPVQFYYQRVAHQENPRLVVAATNEGGHNGTQLDVEDVLQFVKTNYPEVWDWVQDDE